MTLETRDRSSWVMSKARVIILSAEGLTQTEAAALYRVSKSWVSKLMARYRNEGDAAFEPRSRRSHTSPAKDPDAVNEAIVNLRVDLDARPHAIQWHLSRHRHVVSCCVASCRVVSFCVVSCPPFNDGSLMPH